MLDIINIKTFVAAGVILNMTPGIDMLYILNRSITQGKKQGIFSMLGISSGILVHIFIISCGLSTILINSNHVFNFIKYIGSGYLIFLGLKAIINSKKQQLAINQARCSSYRNIYIQGLLTNLLNPKVVIFFLALLPRFVSKNTEHIFLSFLFLGGIFVITSTIWGFCLVIFSSSMTSKMRGNARVSQILNKISGVVFIILGLMIFS